MNDAAVRALFGKASGLIAMSDGYGKSSQVGPSPLFNNANNLNVEQSTYEVDPNTGLYLNSDGSISYWGYDGTVAGPTLYVASSAAGVIQYFDFRVTSVAVSGSGTGYFGLGTSPSSFGVGTSGGSSAWISPTSSQQLSLFAQTVYGGGLTLTGTLEIRNRSNPSILISRAFRVVAYY